MSFIILTKTKSLICRHQHKEAGILFFKIFIDLFTLLSEYESFVCMQVCAPHEFLLGSTELRLLWMTISLHVGAGN